MYKSDISDIERRILNFVRTNSGFTVDQVSKYLSIPLNAIHQAVTSLKHKGLLNPESPTLKIGRHIS